MTERIRWFSYWRPKDAWYYADREVRIARLRAWQQIWRAAQDAGAVHVSTSSIRANSPWARVSVWEFPSVEALLSMVEALEGAGYQHLIETESVVGVPDDDPFAPYVDAAEYTDSVA